jgi:predicted lipid-binding transport protein (Tim44 family)
MNIQTTQIKPISNNYKSLARAHQQSQEAPTAEPQDTFTFSSDTKRAVLPIVGMGVMMTGMMAGARAGNTVVMMGSMFAGLAIVAAAA